MPLKKCSMFRSRMVLIPALISVIMLTVCMDVHDWVHYTWHSEDAPKHHRNRTVPIDWTLGLFHVAVWRPCETNHTDQDHSRRGCRQTQIHEYCPSTKGGQAVIYDPNHDSVCLPWIFNTRCLIIAGICLHLLSQLIIALEDRKHSRRNCKLWALFALSTMSAGVLEMASFVHFLTNAEYYQTDGPFRADRNAVVFVLFGTGITVTFSVAFAGFWRSMYLLCDEEPAKPIAEDTRPGILQELSYLVSKPLSLRRRASRGDIILSPTALTKVTRRSDHPPSYQEAIEVSISVSTLSGNYPVRPSTQPDSTSRLPSPLVQGETPQLHRSESSASHSIDYADETMDLNSLIVESPITDSVA